MSRFLVAQSPLERGDGALAVPPCGVRLEDTRISIVVKVTFDVAVTGGEVADLFPSVPQPGFQRDAELERAPEATLAPGAWLESAGVLRPGRTLLRLPVWRIYVDVGDTRAELLMTEALLDTHARRLTLFYRGHVATSDSAPACWTLLRVVPGNDEPRPADVRAHGVLSQAWLASDVPDGPPPLAAAARLAARIDPREQARPRLKLDEYAVLSARLVDAPAERETVLASAGYTEDRWAAEEVAWLNEIASRATNGDPSFAVALGELLAAEQARLAAGRPVVGLESYARLHVALEEGLDTSALLKELNLSVAGLVRASEHWQASAESDEATHAALTRALEAERARIRRVASQGETSRGEP